MTLISSFKFYYTNNRIHSLKHVALSNTYVTKHILTKTVDVALDISTHIFLCSVNVNPEELVFDGM